MWGLSRSERWCAERVKFSRELGSRRVGGRTEAVGWNSNLKHCGALAVRQKIVALTAHAMKGDEWRCLAVGMDGYLTKPSRPEELDMLLEKWASERAAAHDVPANVETR